MEGEYGAIQRGLDDPVKQVILGNVENGALFFA
jgi:hypothetical protein